MRAAIMQGLHQPLVVETLPDPTPGADELVVRVERCGICGSDLHATEDAVFGRTAGTVLGHEFAGEVVALGSGLSGSAQGLAIGDLVSVSPLRSCGTCASCRAGETAWCDQFGLQMGGYAEYVTTRPNQCVRLPAELSMADGALVEPLAVALHGVTLSGIRPGDKVLILGAGPIGLAVAFWARRAGAARVVVQDIADWQRERAMLMGAGDFVVDRDDPVGASTRALGGMADIVFECVGVPGLIAQAVRQVRPRGTILLLGLCNAPDTINSFAMVNKELRIITSAFFTRGEYEAALDALERGAAEPRAMISQTIGLDQTPEIFESLKQRTHQCKVMIAPAG